MTLKRTDCTLNTLRQQNNQHFHPISGFPYQVVGTKPQDQLLITYQLLPKLNYPFDKPVPSVHPSQLPDNLLSHGLHSLTQYQPVVILLTLLRAIRARYLPNTGQFWQLSLA
ncbi:hypothetical protein [Spirosoma sp.]|uniref:hypothetical protein n=1 Tax=Spirosoma sp. TaxID=1899569 RepID=UPI00263496D5|nr:hypothetical protein [Spirosoma sp.]MCX6216345.1 hypothetical protein [Spirosoma sp.]